LPETVEHSFDFVDLLVELSVLFGADIGQSASQKDLVLDLAGRASSQTQEVSQLAVFCAATSSLRDSKRHSWYWYPWGLLAGVVSLVSSTPYTRMPPFASVLRSRQFQIGTQTQTGVDVFSFCCVPSFSPSPQKAPARRTNVPETKEERFRRLFGISRAGPLVSRNEEH
jgi:hypothetical protein